MFDSCMTGKDHTLGSWCKQLSRLQMVETANHTSMCIATSQNGHLHILALHKDANY